MLDFRLLGPLEVGSDNGPLALGGRRERSVLALLLLHAGQVVPTDRLLDDLWGERPPPTASTSLQNAVSQLRKVLGAERLRTRAPGYLLEATSEEIDVARFESLLREARDAPAERRAELLRRSLELWRGPPLADFAFDDFARSEIVRLEELRLAALEERIEADLELGRAAEVVGEVESLVSENPLRERLRGHLMAALYQTGRQADAVRVYHEGRRQLVDELGIEPSPPLQQLYASMIRQEYGVRPARSEEAGPDSVGEAAEALLAGRLVTVLGPGVNAAGRPAEAAWNDGELRYLPEPGEIALHLARRFGCGDESELARVGQLVALLKGVGPLYDELHAVLDADYPTGPVHRLLAALPPLLRVTGAPQQLIVTTNYDEALERAFAEAGEAVDVVSYVAAGRDRGRFLHVAADGSSTVVQVANTYTALTSERPVILKVHGQVDRTPGRERESFAVSEDDYIAYLAQTDMAGVVPVTLAARLRRSHLLFLGYALQDWSLRVFLHRLFGEDVVAYRSWAVLPEATAVEREGWRRRQVDLVEAPLAEYVRALQGRVVELAEGAS